MTAAPAQDTDRRITVYVVTFPPADDQGGFGGFFWDRSLTAMQAVYEEEFQRSAADPNPRLVRLVPVTVTDGDASQITEELDARADEVESQAAALRQFVPRNTIRAHVPTGGAGAPRPTPGGAHRGDRLRGDGPVSYTHLTLPTTPYV